ncbi:hypothetical protein JCM16138_24610 [Thermococcus atlanticus]
MGKITLTVDDAVEEEFRKLAAQKYGARKGALGSALTEAMLMWIAKAKADLEKFGMLKE